MATRNCTSCGTPMEQLQDFPLGDLSKRFCSRCAKPDGSMKSYEEALQGMAAFMSSSQGIPLERAVSVAQRYMAEMPAWREYAP